MSLVRKFASVGGATMLSRVLGFAREALMAAALGAGPFADVFFAAFRFPNLFRRLFAEGAFNAAFVPLFARHFEGEGRKDAERFSTEVFSVLFSALLLLTIAMELAMPLLVATVIAPGFADDADKFDATVTLSMIMFPYLMCMSLAAMMAGILNSLQRYFAAAIAPVFLNVILIAVLGTALILGVAEERVAFWMSWGVLAAGLLQLAIVTIGARSAGIRVTFRMPKLTPNVKRLLVLAGPAAITGGITQINLVIGQIIASQKDGAISVLQYADRVYQLPLGIVGIAVGVVLLPELARALRGERTEEAAHLQNRSVEFTLALTLPAAAAILAISPEIVRLLYQRGAFTPETTEVVASVLAIFGLGLPAFVLIKCFQPAFFAREDTRTPMLFSMISVAVNIALALTLFPIFEERGIATAEIFAGWTNALGLLTMLLLRGHWQPDRLLLRRLPRLLFAVAVMGVTLWYLSGWTDQWFGTQAFIAKLLTMLLLAAVAFVLYFGLAYAIGGLDRNELRQALRRKKEARPSEETPPDMLA
ncbi:murein biosynthesis integral membrane protein MurJ [Notoacmeibacter sp. MSK16QG-6]|uniref:murein biosynthesis integral membrane protein MurJ n=1 Tax=Notoacmeibacter sp. MSK16QG-6 TaxID=2957982 RepID=UPI00209FBA79|nr:murein biosynthesis integral membrane protein MurJ [Notoacmeibacter sp. MSK16QG-6]MCP1198915.1 murein biosynthesis integral membrane protein MurJ [Notoacmeibacter sp. MSK16QG-6]